MTPLAGSDESERKGLAPRVLGRLAGAMGPYLGLALIVLLFAWWTSDSGTFMTALNWRTIAIQSVIVGTVALGMTQVMISGGIDLSVGSVVALVTVAIARLVNGAEFAVGAASVALPTLSVPLAMVGGIALGGLCGLLNGALVVRLGVVPFIITLGTMKVYRGLAKWASGSTSVYIDANVKPGWFKSILSTDADLSRGLRGCRLGPLADALDAAQALPAPFGRVIGELTQLAPGVWLLLAAAVFAAIVLKFSLLGRYLHAVGSNEATARLCGVAVGRVKLWAYAAAGLLAGLGGVLQFTYLGGTGDPTTADGLELQAIAAVVIGGGSLAGGEGRVSGTLIGVLIMSVLSNGCVHASISNSMQDVLIGAIIVLAVAIDRFRRSDRG